MIYDICVIGLGYIGLPTASIFATKGKNVLGVDIRAHVVDTINRGQIHIEEPELDVLVKSAVQSGNLKAALTPAAAFAYIIAVPTPFTQQGLERKPDLSFVEAAARSIAGSIFDGALVILESTSPVGTTELTKSWIDQQRRTLGLPPIAAHYAHCPERILPGQMIKELVTNDRICGGLNQDAAERSKQLYQEICTGTILLTDARTAEMVKLAENASRDVSIAFANELSIICDRLGLNVWEVIRLANHHPRVDILQPGPGVGGHCIAVDPWFIVSSAPEQARLIRTAREVNDYKPAYVLEKIRAASRSVNSTRIACLGLAFKANVDDLRESPAMEIAEHLADEGFDVLVAEPHVSALPVSLQRKNVQLVHWDQACSQSDIIVMLVNHRAFGTSLPAQASNKIVIDTRGIWNSWR